MLIAFRERRRNFIEAVNARDFLGQIVGQSDIVAPIGDGCLVSRRKFYVDGLYHVADRRADILNKIVDARIFRHVVRLRAGVLEQVAERRADIAYEIFDVGLLADFARRLAEIFRGVGNFIDDLVAHLFDLVDGVNLEAESLKHVDDFRIAVRRAKP